jgi:hypothetical protein
MELNNNSLLVAARIGNYRGSRGFVESRTRQPRSPNLTQVARLGLVGQRKRHWAGTAERVSDAFGDRRRRFYRIEYRREPQ